MALIRKDYIAESTWLAGTWSPLKDTDVEVMWLRRGGSYWLRHRKIKGGSTMPTPGVPEISYTELKVNIRNAVDLLEKEVAKALKEGAVDDALSLLHIMNWLDPEKRLVIEMAIKLLGMTK